MGSRDGTCSVRRPKIRQPAADVDVLVVCKSDDDDAIRRLVDAIEFYRPLHLSILTEDEERETGFAERQGCIHVY